MTTEFLNVPVWLWVVGFCAVMFIIHANHFLGKMRQLSRDKELEEWHTALFKLESAQEKELRQLKESCYQNHAEEVALLKQRIERGGDSYSVGIAEIQLDAIRDKVNDRHKQLSLKHNLQHNDLRAKHYRVLGHGL